MTLYLATGEGPIVVTRDGDGWRAARPLDVSSDSSVAADLFSFSCIAPDLLRPEQVFYGTSSHGAWRSDDAGKSWRRVFEGLPHKRITSLAVSPVERVGGHGVVYAGTEPSAVFRSEDGGETWRECADLTDLPSASEWSFPPRPETHHARWIEPDPHAPGRIFVAIEAGALVSTPDGGKTWRDRASDGPRDTHQLATHPDAPGRLWSAGGYGFYESGDAGDSWRQSNEGLRFTYCYSVAIDPADRTTAMLSAASYPLAAYGVKEAESAIYRRTGDRPWQEIHAGLPESRGTRIPVLAANSAEPAVFYCAAESALYRSSDAGATWQWLNVKWPTLDRGWRAHALAAVGVQS